MKKKMNGTICAYFLAVLALGISGAATGESGFPAIMKRNCNYTVRIETTCTQGAATSNHISVRFGDTNSNDVLVSHLNSKHMRQVDPLQPAAGLDDVPMKPFQACTVDEFQVTGPCVNSLICYFYLKSIGSDEWRPGVAQVRVMGLNHLSSNDFYFRRYLPRHVWHGTDTCDTQVSPFGIKRKRKVFGNTNTMLTRQP